MNINLIKKSETKVWKAVIEGDVEELTKMLESGISLEVVNDSGNTIFHEAVLSNSLEIMHLLLSQNKVKVNSLNGFGWSPLHLAIKNGSYEAVKLLLDAGASVNLSVWGYYTTGPSPIHLALDSDKTEILDLLLAQDTININLKNNRGYTPLLLAVKSGKLEAAKSLIQAGVDVHFKWSENHDDSLLHVAVEYNRLQILRYLLSETTIDVNIKNKLGWAPLFLAARRGSYEGVKILVDAGADVNVSNNARESPLHAGVSCPQISHFLIQQGAKLDVVDYKEDTPLHNAVMDNCVETVCMLLYYNADANLLNEHGHNAFLTAVRLTLYRMQEILFEYSSMFDPLDGQYYSPFEIALIYRSPYAEQILERCTKTGYQSLEYFLDYVRRLRLDFPNDLGWMFKKVWDTSRIVGTINIETICNLDVTREIKELFLGIIVDSPNTFLFSRWLTCIWQSDFLAHTIFLFHCNHFDNDLLIKLIFRVLLENLCEVTVKHICMIFYLYGNCKLLKLLRYMDHSGDWYKKFDIWRPRLLPRIMFDVSADIGTIKADFLNLVRPRAIPEYKELKTDFEEFLHFCSDTKISRICKYPNPRVSSGNFPKLLELARDTTRDHIIKIFKITKTHQYYTIVDELEIAPDYKEILKFETKLY